MLDINMTYDSLPNTLPLDALRTFTAAARTGSFTEAAKAVHRTQSAVSMQIKRLEDEVGAALFHRQGRGVRLTPTGEALLPYAARLTALHREALQSLGCLTGQSIHGTVRLGCPEDYASLHLPQVLKAFAQEHPMVRVDVWCAASEDLLAMLADGALDATLATHTAPPPRGEVLHYEPLVWIGPIHGTLAVEVATCSPLPVAVFHHGCGYRRWALDALERDARAYRIAFTSPSVAGIVAAVKAGLAIAPVGKSVASHLMAHQDGCRVLGPGHGVPALPAAPIALHTSPSPLPPAIARLCTSLRAAFQHTPPPAS